MFEGCSIYLIDINPSGSVKRKNPIPGISTFFDFEFKVAFAKIIRLSEKIHFQDNGLLVRKYAGVGNGRLIPNKQLSPNESRLTVAEEGGYLELANAWVTLKTGKNRYSS